MKIFSLSFLMFLWVGLLTAQDCQQDNIPPIAKCLSGVTFQLDETGVFFLFPVDLDDGSSDNCSSNLRFTFGGENGTDMMTFNEVGSYKVTVKVVDEAENESWCETVVFIKDKCTNDVQPPMIRCIYNYSIPIRESGFATVFAENLDVGSVDNCSSNLKFSFSSDIEDNTKVFTEPGNYKLILWATDEAGNQSYLNSADVTVVDYRNGCEEDQELPVSNCLQELYLPLGDDGLATLYPIDLDNESYDNCSDVLSFSFFEDIYNGNTETEITFDKSGQYNVILIVRDEVGYLNICSTRVNVGSECEEDIQAPVVVCNSPLGFELDKGGSFTLFPEDIDNGSYDNCTSNLNFSLLTSFGGAGNRSLTFEEAGEYEVILKVRDGAGNENFCLAEIFIRNDKSEACLQVPTDLNVNRAVNDQVVLSWSPLLDIKNYLIQGRVKGSETWQLNKKVSSNTFSINKNLRVGQVYEWRVRANCGREIESPFSEIQSFTYGSDEDANQIEGRTTGIIEKTTQIFPSPTTQILNIISKHPVERIQIFDFTGKLLQVEMVNHFQQSTQIDVQHLNSGHYILKLIAADHMESLQFVKE
ncbi:MAG: T9SS type A sorting domain-containing protein [Bacteroidota bacterium]